MNSEKEIVLALLKDVKKQLEVGESADVTLKYEHPKYGMLRFRMKTRRIESVDFDKGTLALAFSINECRSTVKAGNKEKIIDGVNMFITDPKPILAGINNKYRMLFDYT